MTAGAPKTKLEEADNNNKADNFIVAIIERKVVC